MTKPKRRICVTETSGIDRQEQCVSFGVELERGSLHDINQIVIVDECGDELKSQCRVTNRWLDGSIRWVHLVFNTGLAAHETRLVYIDHSFRPSLDQACDFHVEQDGDTTRVSNENTTLTIATDQTKKSSVLATIESGGSTYPVEARLTGSAGLPAQVVVESAEIVELGSCYCDIYAEGRFTGRSREAELKFSLVWRVFTACAPIQLEFKVANECAASHPSNLWDLGDKSSCYFDDLTVALRLRSPARMLTWEEGDGEIEINRNPDTWSLYQDSSGGENWASTNHLDGSNELSVSFRGYQVKQKSSETRFVEGRAQPTVFVHTDHDWIGVTVEKFWQNFPSALRFREDMLEIGLFPGESKSNFEIQGGEQKRHKMWFEICRQGQESCLDQMVNPPLLFETEPASADRYGSEELPAGSDVIDKIEDYIESIVEGPNAFIELREVIDEYGWRNFGDLYADHEAVNHNGAAPLVSHYNNQYDFVLVACKRAAKCGNPVWHMLADDCANHTADIDIYHTNADRPAFNGGMFWHTDHYVDAATSSHRCFSVVNGSAGDYGGGPSNEHNYSSGLLQHYLMTGDQESKHAVKSLANWVIEMDDGAKSVYAVLGYAYTGLASQTVSADYHRPGRGAGNSINTLIDGHFLTGESKYVSKAEELIFRCIHPEDPVHTFGFDFPEHTWSYLVFLQSLCKYLNYKCELEQLDRAFYYARDSLLNYAMWMVDHEVPYLDILDRVEIPSETWSAQDIRKAHILLYASNLAKPRKQQLLFDKGLFFLERCITDLLSFNSAYLTRPRVIVAAYGPKCLDLIRSSSSPQYGDELRSEHDYDFGTPTEFDRRDYRSDAPFLVRLGASYQELCRLLANKFSRL